MNKLIKYLKENPQLITLVQSNKLSLVGVSKLEQQAILEALNEPMTFTKFGWR